MPYQRKAFEGSLPRQDSCECLRHARFLMSRGLAKLAHRANGIEHPRRGVEVWAQPAEALRPSREAAWMWMIKRQKHIRTEPAGQFVVRGFRDERAAVRLRTIDFSNQAVA